MLRRSLLKAAPGLLLPKFAHALVPALPPFGAAPIKQTLNLNFTGGSIDSRVTVTRSGSVGSVANSSGVLTAPLANTGRLWYNPATLISNGILIEESRINTFDRSEALDTITLTNTTASTSVSSPDGGTNAQKIKETNATGNHAAGWSENITPPGDFTLSVWAQSVERTAIALFITDSGFGNWAEYQFDLSVGSCAANSGNNLGSQITAGVCTIEAWPSGWYRCMLKVHAITTTSLIFSARLLNASFSDSYTGVTGNGVNMFGMQLEAGSFATSYIKNSTGGGGPITRNADQVTIATNTFGWNSTRGTIAVQGVGLVIGTAANPRVIGFDTASNANAALRYASSSTVDAINGTDTFTAATLTPWTSSWAAALQWSATKGQLSGNGTPAASSVLTGNFGSVATLGLLQAPDGTNRVGQGGIRQVQVFNR